MKQNNQAKIALLMVLGIFIVAVATCVTVYYLQDLEPATSQDEKVKSEVYSNSQYDYKFLYSPQYNVSETKSKGGANGAESDLVTLEAKKSETVCPEAVTVFISKSSLAEELADLEFRIKGETSDIEIGDVTAKKRVGTLTENQPACGNEVTEIVFSHKDNTFVIKAFKDSTDLLDKVLAKFWLY